MNWTVEARQWFAIQVRPRAEKFVAQSLRSKGYHEFVPTYRPAGRRAAEVPLIPNYVFCRLNAEVRYPIVSTPGVVRIVSAGGNPLPIEWQEIASLKTIAEASISARPASLIMPGEMICVSDGPLRGVRGVLHASKSERRLIVSVTLLQRSVLVDLDRAWITVPCPLGFSQG
jgi:transcription antitermination factor NusG